MVSSLPLHLGMGRRSLSAVASPAPSLYILVLAAEPAVEQGAGGDAGINDGPLVDPNDGSQVNDQVNDGITTTNAGVEMGSQAEPEEVVDSPSPSQSAPNS
ncbi:hypothetical protein FRC12_002338 [Ceratobasidium sp. 428]|nr:hypothetical protein FRC12_002338 [Ceratobasidium sp. 428]